MIRGLHDMANTLRNDKIRVITPAEHSTCINVWGGGREGVLGIITKTALLFKQSETTIIYSTYQIYSLQFSTRKVQ